jgi:hypothetical protein
MKEGGMGAGTQLLTLEDSRLTGTFLSRTPQEAAHKGSLQGSSTPGRVPLFPLPWEKGPPQLLGIIQELKGYTTG